MHPGIARNMGIIAVVVGFGLAVKNYYIDEPLLAIVSLVAVALTARFLWTTGGSQKELKFRGAIMLYGNVFAICYSIYVVGPAGVFWTFPLVIASYLLFAPNQARVFSGITTLCIAGLAAMTWDLGLVLRLTASLLIVSLFFDLLAVRMLELNAELIEINHRDPLTGCYNRRFLPRAAYDHRLSGKSSFVLMIDVDKFKAVNDTLGHAAGDRVLRQIATISFNAVSAGDSVIRLGGDEFLITLLNSDLNIATTVAERIRHEVETSVINEMADITLSIGVSIVDIGGRFEDAIVVADENLYPAKSLGCNRVVSGLLHAPPAFA